MDLSRDHVLWFAGLFEGEGYFISGKTVGHTFGLAIEMTDRDVLEKVQSMFGGTIWSGRKKSKAHHKQRYLWKVTQRDKAYAVIAAVFQFLGTRRQSQAKEWIAKYAALPSLKQSYQNRTANRQRSAGGFYVSA